MAPDKPQMIRRVIEHASAGRWPLALEESRSAAAVFPEDLQLRSLVDDLAVRCAAAPAPPEARPAPKEAAPAPPPASEASDRAFLDEAVRRRVERQGGGAPLGDVIQDSRRVSDLLRAATTRHRADDVAGLLDAARSCLAQDLLPEALRLCQKVLAQEPGNEQVRGLLMEISRRKGL